MAPLSFSNFSEQAKHDLLQLLQSVPGKKNLVLQKALVGPIELLFKFSTLQENGVDRVYFLENDNVDTSQKNVIFVASGEKMKHPQAVASQVKRLQQTSQTSHDFSVCWVPRRTLIADKVMEEAGVLGDVTTSEWPLYLQPMDDSLLSMELETSFGELYLHKDPTSIFLAAKALMRVQQEHGLFPRIYGKGEHAKRLADLLIRMRLERAANHGSSYSPDILKESMPSTTIENLIIIDRETDLATPLLTQLTYEGLIDETFGIKHGQVEVDSSILGPNSQQQQQQHRQAGQGTSSREGTTNTTSTSTSKQKHKLDPVDALYTELRYANFAIVGNLLNRVAKRLQSFQNDYQGKQGSNKTIAELRDLLTKVPGYHAEQQSLKLHTSLAEEIMKTTQSDTFRKILEIQQNAVAGTDPSSLIELLESLIACECSLQTTLRLFCLLSVAAGGLRAKELDGLKRQILQAYGYQHLLTLAALEKMTLVQSRSGIPSFLSSATGATSTTTGTAAMTAATTPTNYSAIRRPLQLILDEVSEQDPTDTAYTYSGYAPLSIRLVQCLLQKPYITSLVKSSSTTSTAASAVGISSNGTTAADSSSTPSWRGFEDVLKNIKGPTFDIPQRASTPDDKAAKARQTLNGASAKRTTVVFFLGGVTFAEIAALRFVAKQEAERRDIVIATTSMISGEKMMDVAIAESNPVN